MESSNNDVQLLTITSTTKLLKIGRNKIIDLVNTGKLKVIPIGKRNYIPKSEVIRFVNECTTQIQIETNRRQFQMQPLNDCSFDSVNIFSQMVGGQNGIYNK